MKFEVSSEEGGTATYSSFDLVQLLMRDFTGRSRDDLDEIARSTSVFLQRSESLQFMNVFQLLHVGVMLGFYYAMLKKNYTVEVVNDSEHEQSSDQGGVGSDG